MEPPGAVYSRLLLQYRTRMDREQRWDRRLGYAKVFVFLAGAMAAVLLLHSPRYLALLLISMAFFLALVVAHERVLRRVRECNRAAEFYARGLRRVQDQWAGTGETGDRFLDEAHPYARDLDLFGKASVFELLCTARTRAGEETLASWLLHPALPAEVRQRHSAILEIRDRLNFRERLFAAGESVRLGVHPEALAAWGEKKALLRSGTLRVLIAVLALVWMVVAFRTAVLSVASLFWGTRPPSFLLLFLVTAINFGVSLRIGHSVAESITGTEHATEDLQLLAEVLRIVENERFEASRLHSLQVALTSAGVASSIAVRRLSRIVQWLEARRNLFVRLFDRFVFYRAQLTFAVEHWRATFGPEIRGWLQAAGEFEALAALAGYAWEHPEDVLPEFVEGQPYFEAEGLAHPLLPTGKAVGNDLTLSREVQLIVISGPNMAGKSTFLRGVGMNAVLAQCGAPVRARRLRLSQMAVGASICVLDSLQGGVSRFYAEIRRLKLLSDLADGPAPLLFLLDELLSGTNSHDRLDGTRFVVRALLRRGAVGLVTTHDLALTGIPEALDGVARNCHFEDSIEDGKLKFDYRLKPGIVRTSNALKLMQAVGLDVEE